MQDDVREVTVSRFAKYGKKKNGTTIILTDTMIAI